MPEPRLWELRNFLPRLDEWVEREAPIDYQRNQALLWIMTRADNPYADVQREPNFPNLWYGWVPDTLDVRGRVVVCSFWISETEHAVTCESWSLLGWPV